MRARGALAAVRVPVMPMGSHGVDVRFSRGERLPSRRLRVGAAGLAFVAVALIGAACSAPIPTPTPTSTPAPTATSTPTPQPASYRISYDGARFGAAADGLVEAELLLSLTNTGEVAGIDVPVSTVVDGGVARDADPIARLAPGETIALDIAHSLPPGDRRIVFRAGDSERRETVSVLAADIAVAFEGHAIAGNGKVSVETRVANSGNLAADKVVVSAAWTPRPAAEGVAGLAATAARINRIAGGESSAASLLLPIPTGAYDLALSVSTSSREAATNNNHVVGSLEVEYVQLAVEVSGEEVTGYESVGVGVVELRVRVLNTGATPSGPLTVGAACAEGAAAPCEAVSAVDSIAPAESADVVVALALPQGENALAVYAGANEDGYRWGERNVAAHAVSVPEKSPVALTLSAPIETLGYRSDGTADVEVAITLANDGYLPLTETVDVTVACFPEDASSDALEADCGGVTSVALTDGFGPATAEVAYSVPMGVTLRASLPDNAQATAGIVVPERILGVERDIWKCYSDRPNWEATIDNDILGGCAGWTEPTVTKWQPGLPVRVWADPTGGHQRYVDILRQALDELAPLLGLDIQWTESEAEANLKAYVGVPKSRNASIGFPGYCADRNGCGGPDNRRGGAITSASLSVWLNDEHDNAEIKFVALHEILHAVTGVHHALSPLSVMFHGGGLRLNRLGSEDSAIYRLQGHTLVEPGMTMAEVEERIVFADELLDPPAEAELDGIAIAERAYAALIEAGSARFRIEGGYRDANCTSLNFAGRLNVGDLAKGSARLLNFDRGYDQLVAAYSPDTGWRYWQERSGAWTLTARNIFWDETNWSASFTDPVDMLISVLRYADTEAVSVGTGASGTLELSLMLANHRSLPVSWARGAVIDIGVTLDAETYAMTGYRMEWGFDVISSSSCSLYQVTATEGQFGVDIPDPR